MSSGNLRDEILQRDIAVYLGQIIRNSIPFLFNAKRYGEAFSRSELLYEHPDCGGLIVTPLRELILIAEADVSRSVRKMIKRNSFSVTTNQHFSKVLEVCAQSSRGNEKNKVWIGSLNRRFLSQLREQDRAHSVEIHKDGELVGGALYVQYKRIVTGLSVFGLCDGAGNATVASTLALIQPRGFLGIDAIKPSQISRTFGGRLFQYYEFVAFRSKVITQDLKFPTIQQQVPVAELFNPPTNSLDVHGWSGACKESFGLEMRDGGQARRNIEHIGARHRGLVRARPV